MNKPIPYYCPVVDKRVMIVCSTFEISGIGSEHAAVQRDYSCACEDVCEYRQTAACKVRQLSD